MSIFSQLYGVGMAHMIVRRTKHCRISHRCIHSVNTCTRTTAGADGARCKSLWVQGRRRNLNNMSNYSTLSSAPPSYSTSPITFHCIYRAFTSTSRAAGSTSSSPSPHAFPLEHHKTYKSIMKSAILSNPKYTSRKKSLIDQKIWSKDMFDEFEQWLLQTKPAVDQNVLSERWNAWRKQWMDEYLAAKNSSYTTEGSQDMAVAAAQYKLELAPQCKVLQDKILTDTRQQRRDTKYLMSQSFPRLLQFVFHNLIDHCLGGISRPSILPVAWHKMKESGVLLSAAKLRLMLNMVIDSDELAVDQELLLMEELLIYHDLLCGDEIAALPDHHKHSAMLKYYSEIPDHHRYSAMLRYYCDSCNTTEALRLLREMKARKIKSIKSDLFILVLATLAENGQFRNTGGARLFDKIVTDMAAQASEISPSCATRLQIALEKEFLSPDETNTIQTPPTTHEKLCVGQVKIDPLTLTCPLTGVRMSSKSSLSADERKQMHDDILALTSIQSSLAFEMNEFLHWLNNREGPPFAAIVDGANIGASNVKSVMLSLESEGRNPLAIINEKDSRSAQIKKYCVNNDDKVYIVKNGLEEDLFCILGTVADQQQSRRCFSGKDALAEKERTMLVTTDFVREHRSRMRDSTLSRQWYEHHIQRIHSQGPTVEVQDSFTPSQRKQVFNDVLQLAYKKSTALNDLKAFSDWMVNRKGHPFSVIIDGANVMKIEAMVKDLQAKGEHPLVIFPEQSTNSRLEVSYRLRNSGHLYIVPHGLEDDIFCMFATVLDQQNDQASSQMNLHGRVPVLITNDRFRDHKTKLRDPSLVDKWYSSHCFNHFQHVMKMLPTNVFRRKIEQNDRPTNTELYSPNPGTKVWHFPVSGWGFHERFVVSLPSQCSKK